MWKDGNKITGLGFGGGEKVVMKQTSKTETWLVVEEVGEAVFLLHK